MKQIIIIMTLMGMAVITACSSNDANIKSDDAVSDSNSEEVAAPVSVTSESEAKPVEAAPVVAEEPPEEAEPAGFSNKISVCKSGSSVRTISVIYKQGESSTSCEVTYEKSTGVQTLWTAKSDLSYCLNKAKEFVVKQEGWGWSCSSLD